MANGQASLILI